MADKQYYPKWIDSPHGRMIVHSPLQHSQMIGKEVDAQGNVIEEPKPPTLDEVLAAGYKEPAASQIVAEEQEKFEKGYKPYGNVEPPPPPVEPPPAEPAADPLQSTADPSKVDEPVLTETSTKEW